MTGRFEVTQVQAYLSTIQGVGASGRQPGKDSPVSRPHTLLTCCGRLNQTILSMYLFIYLRSLCGKKKVCFEKWLKDSTVDWWLARLRTIATENR